MIPMQKPANFTDVEHNLLAVLSDTGVQLLLNRVQRPVQATAQPRRLHSGLSLAIQMGFRLWATFCERLVSIHCLRGIDGFRPVSRDINSDAMLCVELCATVEQIHTRAQYAQTHVLAHTPANITIPPHPIIRIRARHTNHTHTIHTPDTTDSDHTHRTHKI